MPDDRESVQGLARTLEATGNVAGLVEALELDLSLARDDDDRHRLALAAARAREALASKQTIPEARRAQLERALAHARLACELEPGDAGAHGLYGGLVEQLGRWDLLVEVMTRLAEIVDDTPRASWMLRRAAQVCQVRLSDPQAAVATLRKAVELDPGDVEAWQALEPLADDVEDMALLHEVLERRMALAGSGADRAEFALKLGRVRLQLGRPGTRSRP